MKKDIIDIYRKREVMLTPLLATTSLAIIFVYVCEGLNFHR